MMYNRFNVYAYWLLCGEVKVGLTCRENAEYAIDDLMNWFGFESYYDYENVYPGKGKPDSKQSIRFNKTYDDEELLTVQEYRDHLTTPVFCSATRISLDIFSNTPYNMSEDLLENFSKEFGNMVSDMYVFPNKAFTTMAFDHYRFENDFAYFWFCKDWSFDL